VRRHRALGQTGRGWRTGPRSKRPMGASDFCWPGRRLCTKRAS
jgi:hypothetical protein